MKHTDGTYLLMQRDYKKQFGGKWELTAGGSALQGESPLECAIRELREETGIVCSDLKDLKRVVHDDILKMGEDTLASSRALECMMHDEV